MAVFTTNDAFLKPVLEVMRKRFTVEVWERSGSEQIDLVNLRSLLDWCDAAFFEFCQAPFPQAISMLNLNCKIVLRLHGLPFYGLRRLIPWSKVDLAVCSYPLLLKFEGLKEQPKKLVELAPGVDTAFFNMPKKKKYGKTLITHSTVVRFKKGVYTTLQTFHELLKRDPEWTLRIHGNWETGWRAQQRQEYAEPCRELIEILKLEDHIELIPHLSREGWREWLQSADIFVSNSIREGFQVSGMEAMLCGAYPLVNCWLGADHYYPEQCIFKTQEGLVEKILDWGKLSARQKRRLSLNMREWACRYDVHEIATKICDLIATL